MSVRDRLNRVDRCAVKELRRRLDNRNAALQAELCGLTSEDWAVIDALHDALSAGQEAEAAAIETSLSEELGATIARCADLLAGEIMGQR